MRDRWWIAICLVGAIAGVARADDPIVLKDDDVAKLCAPVLTVCVDRNGNMFASDSLPPSISVGEKLSVVVVTQKQFYQDDVKPGAIVVTFSSVGTQEVLFPTRATPGPNPVPDQPAANVLLRTDISQAITDDTSILKIAIKGAQGVTQQYSVEVNHGFSYYSVALLVAAVPNGVRVVNSDLSVTSDYAVDPALALNVFPGGRERGYIGYARLWHGRDWCARAKRWLANNVGLQIGAGLDLTNATDKIFGGIVFEPVAGLAFSAGLSLRKLAVVPNLADVPLSGTLPAASHRAVRGYVGITMTLDLLQTISSVGSSIKALTNPL